MNLPPILYFPHGAGPMPLLGEPNHQNLVGFLKAFAQQVPRHKAIVIISAHWEESQVTVNTATSPSLLYDYYGFPAPAYDIPYPTKGSAELASRVTSLLDENGIGANKTDQRGWDHGVFVPLKIMYPNGDIPCVQLSLESNLDPSKHIAIGRALAKLREEGVMILGSGSSFHNMSLVNGVTVADQEQSVQFDDWLKESVLLGNEQSELALARLVDWKQAPYALFSHPREEHLLPLQVCLGAAIESAAMATVAYEEFFMGVKVSAFSWV